MAISGRRPLVIARSIDPAGAAAVELADAAGPPAAPGWAARPARGAVPSPRSTEPRPTGDAHRQREATDRDPAERYGLRELCTHGPDAPPNQLLCVRSLDKAGTQGRMTWGGHLGINPSTLRALLPARLRRPIDTAETSSDTLAALPRWRSPPSGTPSPYNSTHERPGPPAVASPGVEEPSRPETTGRTGRRPARRFRPSGPRPCRRRTARRRRRRPRRSQRRCRPAWPPSRRRTRP